MTEPHIPTTLAEFEQDFGGTLGVRAVPLWGGDEVAYRERERFPAASTIKVFVLLELLSRVADGSASLDEEMLLEESDKVTGSGVLKALGADRSYPLADLATLMIIVSDNTATNLLIERLGVEAINDSCRRHGWRDTRLVGKLQQGDASETSHTSPFDLSDHFVRLWRGELLPPELSEIARGIYLRQQYCDGLGRDLGYDGYSSETGASRLRIASKSGSIRGVRNDAGVVCLGERCFGVAVMTKGCADGRFYPDNPGVRTISKVSRALFDHFGLNEGG